MVCEEGEGVEVEVAVRRDYIAGRWGLELSVVEEERLVGWERVRENPEGGR